MDVNIKEEISRISTNEIFGIGAIEYIAVSVLYFSIAGFAFYKLYLSLKDKIQHKKIQAKFPQKDMYWFEIKYSLLTLFIFGLTTVFTVWSIKKGWTKMYFDVEEFGIPYLLFTIVLVLLIHDTYFYWGHRFMHLKNIYPHVHLVHHKSINPTPWAAFCFHPWEAIIEAAVIPLIIFFIPVHYITIIVFFIFMTILNVSGHTGYELFPSGFTKSKWLGWNNTSTHHNMHHSLFNCNYGLYFNFWDKWMGTNHKEYHNTFEKIANSTKDKT